MSQQTYGFALPPVPPGTLMVAPPQQMGQPPEFMSPFQAGFPDPSTASGPDPAYTQVLASVAPSPQPPVQVAAQPQAEPQAQPQATPAISLEQLAAHWVTVDEQLGDSARAWKDYETSMKATREKIETMISAQIPVGTESITLQGRTFKPTFKTRYQTSEGEADVFWAWIKANNRTDLLDKRIAQANAAALIEQTRAWHAEQVRLGAVDAYAAPVERFYPPGLDIKQIPTLSVTKTKSAANLVKE